MGVVGTGPAGRVRLLVIVVVGLYVAVDFAHGSCGVAIRNSLGG